MHKGMGRYALNQLTGAPTSCPANVVSGERRKPAALIEGNTNRHPDDPEPIRDKLCSPTGQEGRRSSAKITPRSSLLRCLLRLSIATSYAQKGHGVALAT